MSTVKRNRRRLIVLLNTDKSTQCNFYETEKSINDENLSDENIENSFETEENNSWLSDDNNSHEYELNIKPSTYTKNYQLINNGFQCKICLISYTEIKQIVSHQKIHKQFSTLCYICGLLTKSHKKLELHIKFHETSQNFQIAKRSKNTRRLLPENKPCHICKKQFISFLKLMEHMNSHTKEKPYICPCGSRFGNHSNFIAHFKKYNCPAEGRIIPDYAPSFLLDPLYKTVGSSNNQSNLKYISKKATNSLDNLEDQDNLHEIDFFSSFCAVCCEDFIINRKLLEHNISVHNIQCDLCGTKFKTENMLRKHIQCMHNICKYECAKCNLIFENKTEYDKHTCEKNVIKCAYCSLEISLNNYKDHVMKHIYRQ